MKRAAVFLALAGLAVATRADPLADGFADPPASARPRVWWHWMDGNITRDGIAKDLDWMKRVGLGGVQTFDVALHTPQIVDHRLVYMSPEWQDAFRFAVSRADALGLEFAIASSPGWSETGGPWVTPADAMKKLVWATTRVVGGRPFDGPLAAPPVVTGPFQTIEYHDVISGSGGALPTFYADIAVLAYPVAPAVAAAVPIVRTGTGMALDAAALADNSLTTGVDLPRGTAQQPAMLTLTYDRPQTIRSATLFIAAALPPFGDPAYTPVLEAQTGTTWRKVAELPLADVPTTVAFAPVTATEFRVVIGPYTGPRRPGLGAPAAGAEVPDLFATGPADAPLRVTDLRLSDEAKIDRFEAKAGFTMARDYDALATSAPDVAGIAPETVVDLTGRMRPGGTLDWTPPPGEWRVLRLGSALTGTTNHPAPREATGLEVDKYDGDAVRRYLATYLSRYETIVGRGMTGVHGINALLTDSTEVGASNWTPEFVEQFRRLRGYDATPWLPALTGTVVGSRVRSDAFLADFRRTLADLHASEHYGTVAAVAHEHGLEVYGEALEDQRPTLGDDMAMRSHTDVPMAAMWTYARGDVPRPTLLADTKGAASVAHLYGQNLAAAESMTSALAPWAFAPSDLKRIIDLEFVQGINRPVIHTSVHQPSDDKVPGLSLLIFGQYFNRHETWAEMARPWIDYIARSSFLLQQGANVADVAYFYGEEGPLTALFGQAPVADAPVAYAYDFVNRDALLGLLSVDHGDLVAPSGARYRLLYLGGATAKMSVAVLRRLATLAEAGATIVGTAPTGGVGLGDDPAAFAALVARLWSGAPVTRVDAGRVIAGHDVEGALRSIGASPDFTYDGAARGDVLFLHRRLTDGDIYFLTNRQNRAISIDARFRVADRVPELWRATTGRAEPVSYRSADGITSVPLHLLAEDALFIVLRRAVTEPTATIAAARAVPVATITGPWAVTFQPGRGAPPAVTMPVLTPLQTSVDRGVRYFSGVATYTTDFDLPLSIQPGAPLRLDLGTVGDIAEVSVNGVPVGTAWTAPFEIDVGRAVHAGRNRLKVHVADLWVNRLIGDRQPGGAPIAFTAGPTYRSDAPLRPSGLIGPVVLLDAK